ncbi:MAG: MMPL family transporter [Myxococcales bacterium]|nr:MMPL family transporter [Myxococcales bacterium]
MNPIERSLLAYARLSNRSPWALLALYAVVTALSLAAASRIHVETGLEALLPDDAPSVVALHEARARRGSQEQFVIAVESPDPLATVRFVDALAAQLQDWEEVEYVDIVRDQTFFRDHILLYLPVEDLRTIDRNLRRIIRQRLGRDNPLFEDLETDPGEADFEWRDWRLWISPYTLVELGIEEDAVGTIFPFLTEGSGDAAEVAPDGSGAAEMTPEEAEEARIRAARWALPDQYRDYRIAPHGRVAVYAARLAGRSTDIDYARRAYERAQQAIAAADPASFHPELRAQVVGAYRSFLEVQAVTHDATRATQIALVMVVGLLVAFFRNLRSLYIVMTPLLAGIAWTGGLLQLVYGHLNTLTVFVFSMLVGMGIDFAIHIYRRMLEERGAGASWEDAAFAAIARTGRALVTATVTTVGSLLMLVFAHFDGFREFGVACGLGVAVCLISSMAIIPPLVAASERVWPTPPRPVAGASVATERRWVLTLCRAGAAVLVVTAIAGAFVAPRVQFEYDFSNLEAPRDPNRIKYGSALGRARSSAPAIILGDSEQQLREVHAMLRERLRADDPLLTAFTTIATAIPGDQDARMDVIEHIYDALDRRAVQNIDGDEGAVIHQLTDLTEVEPFGVEDLPQWSVELIRERDGSLGSLGLLYGNYNDSDARDVARFQEEYSTIEVPSGTARVSSNGFILSDVVRYVIADGERLAVFVTLGLVLVLLLDLRDLRAVAVCLSTLVVALGLTIGAMVVFDIKVGLYNIIVLPTVLGVGIDGSIHLYHRYLEEGRASTTRVLATTGAAVAASSLTTVAGFAGLLLIEHRGVITIGALATVGIFAAMLAALVVVPALVGKPSTEDPTGASR